MVTKIRIYTLLYIYKKICNNYIRRQCLALMWTYNSKKLHAKYVLVFSIFPPQEPVHWVNASHIPVFFVMQDCICPVFLRPSRLLSWRYNRGWWWLCVEYHRKGESCLGKVFVSCCLCSLPEYSP